MARTRNAWLLGAAIGLAAAGCQDRTQEQRTETRDARAQEGAQAGAARERPEDALEAAAEQQKEAAEKREEVAGAQADVREKQEELREAQQEAQQTLNESQQAQAQARSASRRADQATTDLQQQAATEAERQAQETQAQAQERQQANQAQAEQDLVARHDAASAAGQQTVNGRIVRADGQELVLRQQDTNEPDLRLEVDDQTPVTIDGQQRSMSDLQAGMEVRASYDATGAEPKAVKIEAQQGGAGQGQGGAQQPPTEPPQGGTQSQ